MRHLSCNLPTNQRCNNDDPESCCGGGCDEPCSCLHCHPSRATAVNFVNETLTALLEVLTVADRSAMTSCVAAKMHEYRITETLSLARKVRELKRTVQELQ